LPPVASRRRTVNIHSANVTAGSRQALTAEAGFDTGPPDRTGTGLYPSTSIFPIEHHSAVPLQSILLKTTLSEGRTAEARKFSEKAKLFLMSRIVRHKILFTQFCHQ
jgi:hypothetical protein